MYKRGSADGSRRVRIVLYDLVNLVRVSPFLLRIFNSNDSGEHVGPLIFFSVLKESHS